METELWIIRAKISNPQISLPEIKKLWLEAKEILGKINQPSNSDLRAAVDIFNKGIEKVGEFFLRWQEGKLSPTDEELDLLEEAFNEASWAFNFLSTNFPSSCSEENNQGWQKKIKENKQIVSEEKNKRKEINSLQSQINSLRNQPNSNDKIIEKKIRDLQNQIDDLRNKDSKSFSLSEKILIGGVVAVVVVFFLMLIVVWRKRK